MYNWLPAFWIFEGNAPRSTKWIAVIFNFLILFTTLFGSTFFIHLGWNAVG